MKLVKFYDEDQNVYFVNPSLVQFLWHSAAENSVETTICFADEDYLKVSLPIEEVAAKLGEE